MCAALLANQSPATVIAESTGEALDGAVVAAATTPATPWPGLKALAWVRASALSNIWGIPILSLVAFMATPGFCIPATTCANHEPTAFAVMLVARLPAALTGIAMCIVLALTHTLGPSWVQLPLAQTDHEPLAGRHGGPPLQRQKSERRSEPTIAVSRSQPCCGKSGFGS